MELKFYSLKIFEGILSCSEDGIWWFKCNGHTFIANGVFQRLHEDKRVRVKGLPIFGLESYHEIYIDSFKVLNNVPISTN